WRNFSTGSGVGAARHRPARDRCVHISVTQRFRRGGTVFSPQMFLYNIFDVARFEAAACECPPVRGGATRTEREGALWPRHYPASFPERAALPAISRKSGDFPCSSRRKSTC